MHPEAQPEDRDREATTGRVSLALLVVAELLCTGTVIVLLIAWM